MEDLVRVNMKKSAGIRRPGETTAILYGPGENIEVPRYVANALGLEILGETSSSASSDDESSNGEGSGDAKGFTGKTRAELEDMPKDKLVKLAEKHDVYVDRLNEDGEVEEGEPLKGDYVRVLSQLQKPTHEGE